MPAYHKPKLSSERKLSKAAALLQRLGVKDVIVPTSMILLERYKTGKAPSGPFEEHVFKTLEQWQQEADVEHIPSPIAHMTPILNLYKSANPTLKKLLFPEILVNWDLNKPIEDWEAFARAWVTEGTSQAAAVLYDEPTPAINPGKVRRWMGELMDPDICKKYNAPWPWINEVNSIRVREHIPPIDDLGYAQNEYEASCKYSNFNADTNEVQVTVTVNQGECSIPGYKTPSGLCLKVPEVRPGQTVELIGFNFFSKSCKVRIASRQPNGWKGEVEAKVHGDSVTPDSIADGRVRDRITFELPADLPQSLFGFYEITVVVPNDINYDFGGETVSNPAYDGSNFISNTVYLQVLPSGNEKYNMYLWKGKCYKETDGEWGSDEICVNAFPVIFTSGKDQPVKLPTSTSTIWGDVDDGETKVDWNWHPMGETFGSPFVLKDSILALGLVGYEVDSEDALKEQVKQFGDAYLKYLRLLWDGIQAGAAAKAGELSASAAILAIAGWLGVGASLLVAGIALAAVFAVGLIYAGWAPADMIFKDVVVLSETDLFNLTQPHSPMPRPSFRAIKLDGDFSAQITPIYTEDFIYTEERRYQSVEQGSDYGFVFRYQRVA